MEGGEAWVVDALGCDPDRLRSPEVLRGLFAAMVEEMGLRPLGPPVLHAFPAPGGVTGFLLLTESHLACHTFPETGFAAVDLYCCRRLADWPWKERLREILGARSVEVRRLARGGER
jgi:S-adenosylmethionine decarboxylase